jgi:hypothetical protein
VSASAQTGASGIAGVVKDTSGAVLPGVTVEAASPALIERVRIAVTDGSGQYKLVDLPPGTYTVTFTLTGFSTVKREGIELTGSFIASINADLKVGGLAMVSFLIDRTGKSVPPRLAYRLSSWLAGLPGANHAYQLGDVFSSGHFLHAFVTEEELRSEMAETGATIVQLNWDRQFAVLTWPR